MSDDNGGMSNVQKWRLGQESRMAKLEEENKNQTDALGRIEGSVSSLTQTITENHQQAEERMALGRERMNHISNRGWISLGLASVVGAFILILHFGMTISGIAVGASGVLGLIAKVKGIM